MSNLIAGTKQYRGKRDERRKFSTFTWKYIHKFPKEEVVEKSLILDLTETFSDRERQVYNLLCQNLSNRQIAEQLEVTSDCVVYHLKKIYRKLGVQSVDKTDTVAARTKAICYSGTKISQEYQSKAESYSSVEIMDAAKRITWIDKTRVDEVLTDILAILRKEI